jgi:uncharacterized protein (DUF1501 family)
MNRREFMRAAACAAVGTASLVSTVWDLRMINAAVGQVAAPPVDYKALVCLFLFGGNDANNLLIPTNTDATDFNNYNNYAAVRGILALPNAGAAGGVLPINPTNGDGTHTYGLHPSCTGMQTLFESGKLGIVCNVGTLVGPVTQAQYIAKTAAVPPQLFSHNDQQVQWQTSVPDRVSRTGWGGRCADLLDSLNNNNQVSMSMSLAGANTYEVGNVINAYNLSTNFPNMGITLSNVSGARLTALTDLVRMGHPYLFEDAFAVVTNRAVANASIVNNAVASAPTFTTPFVTTAINNNAKTSLCKQMENIARLIYARTALGHNRQIFFCSVGGYDTHGDQLVAQAKLYDELSCCLKAFYDATVQLGVAGNVTTFTASDFSRTFAFNGSGTDHAWGSHAIVVGDSVLGKKLYGTYPQLKLGGTSDTSTSTGSTGRWIPTTAVDQYSATLAKWFGVQNGDMASVFPNIGRFASSDLGFMAAS